MDETILTEALNPKIIRILIGFASIIVLALLVDKFLAPKMRLKHRKNLYGYIFVAIPLIYFIAVLIVPMVSSFQYSFQKYNILSAKKPFAGLDNYQYLIESEVFVKAIKNSFKYALFRVPLVISLSLITALMFQTIKRYKNLLRTLMLLPFMTSSVALGWIFNNLYSRQGAIFVLLKELGVPETKALLTLNVKTALFAIAFVSAWSSIGYYTLLFSVGLDAIPEEIYDAAKVDGANRWQLFSKITWPLLNPSLVLISIVAVTASLKNFDLIRVMSGSNGTGGPMNSTLTMPLFIYMEAFTRLNMGRAAASTVVFFLIIMVITLIQLKVTQRDIQY